MDSKIVKAGQSLMDFVLQHTGSLNYLVAAAKLNNISPTDRLTPGTALLVPSVSNDITKYFQNKAIIIATDKAATEPGGIGYMAVEIDFYTR